MRVLLYPADKAGCAYVRCEQPLRVSGAEGEIRDALDVRHKVVRGQVVERQVAALDADVIVFQRPPHEYTPMFIEQLKRQGIAVVVDVDDDFRAIHPDNIAFPLYAGHERPDVHARHLGRSCAVADLVTVSTPALAERYGAHGRVAVLPNCVPEKILDYPRCSDGNTVGWSGRVAHHPGDLESTRGGVGEALGDWHFHVIGEAAGVRERLRLPSPPIETAWLRDMDAYHHALGKFDVGIVPLGDTAFNAAKCLDATTRLMTRRGVRRAEDIAKGDQVWQEGRWRRVEAVYSAPLADGLCIETALGLRLRLTRDHRLRSRGEWRHAEELKVGEVLDLAGEEWPADLSYVRVPWPAEARRSRGGFDPKAFQRATSGPALTIDELWGRILGLFAGDGSAAGKTGVCFSMDGQDGDLIEALVADFRAAGLPATTETLTTWGGEVLRRRSVRVACAPLSRTLEAMGVLTIPRENGARKRIVCVPDVIWCSPRSVVASFLSGLFEADGHVAGTSVGFCSKEEDLVRDVQRLLVGFGIFARAYPKKGRGAYADRTYWHITLRRAETDLFAQRVGFLSRRKRQRLAEVVGKPHSNAYRPCPVTDEIVSVTPCEVCPVDLQVEGSVFAAAGIVSHNSHLKGIEMAARGVPFIASPRAEYQALGIGLLAADRARNWRSALRSLMGDETLRGEIAEQGREVVAERYTYEKQGWRWAQAWEQAILNRKAA